MNAKTFLEQFLRLIFFPLEKNNFSEAGIAKTLTPLLKKHLAHGAKIKMVGSAGDNLFNGTQDPSYPKAWQDPLRSLFWGKADDIYYLLVGPDDQAWKALEAIATEVNQREGRECFHIARITNADEVKDEKLRGYAKDARTGHFLLAENPKLLWLEGHHPPGSTTAYDCKFVPPTDAAQDPRHKNLSVIFDKMFNAAEKTHAANEPVEYQPA